MDKHTVTSDGVYVVQVTNPQNGWALPPGSVEVPPAPGPWAKWQNGGWVEDQTLKASYQADEVRAQRSVLLKDVDAVAGNVLRWAVLSADQQALWSDYRQALLDVPSQGGFPHDVVWPSKPE